MYFKNNMPKDEQETTIRVDRKTHMTKVWSSDQKFINRLHRKGYDFDEMGAWQYHNGEKYAICFETDKNVFSIAPNGL